jgi:NADPH-dependent 2,4-dienoyl-CoA reductase/sulfur reductase-like enzyme
MRTGLPGIYAAGDRIITHYRLLGETFLPLGTTAHKQGQVAGENALGGHREFAGSLCTQVVKRIDVTTTAIFHAITVEAVRDLDLFCTARLGGPWEVVLIGVQARNRQAHPHGAGA